MTIAADRLEAALGAFIAEAAASPESYTPEQLQEIVGLAARMKATLAHHARNVAADPKEHIARVGSVAAALAVEHLAGGDGPAAVAGLEPEHVRHLAAAMHHHALHYAARAREAFKGGAQGAPA